MLSFCSRLCFIAIAAILVTTVLPSTLFAAKARKVVVLSHGWSSSAKEMAPLAKHLKKYGFEAHAISYQGRLLKKGINAYSKDLSAFIKKLKLKRADQLNLVGHSMGGVISRWYAEKIAPKRKIANVITICSPHNGTLWGNVTNAAKKLINMDPKSGTASDVRITSPTIKSLRKDPLRKDIKYTALWLPNDKVVIPGKSGIVNGARNIVLPKKGIKHTSARHVPLVLKLVVQILKGKNPATKGPQKLTTLDLFRLGLLDPADFGELSAKEQVKGLNDLVAAKVVGAWKEAAILKMLGKAKPGVAKKLNHSRFYKKFQGKNDLHRLYKYFGAVAPIECALGKKSKRIANRDVTDTAIRKASVPLLGELLKLLLKAPVGNSSEKLIIRVLQLRKSHAKTLAKRAGGVKLFYKRIQGKEKKKLKKLLPK